MYYVTISALPQFSSTRLERIEERSFWKTSGRCPLFMCQMMREGSVFKIKIQEILKELSQKFDDTQYSLLVHLSKKAPNVSVEDTVVVVIASTQS
jgi:hypothetical protein